MLKKDIKIIFMGTPDFASMILKSLFEAGFTISGVITQPDKERGRGQKKSIPEVKKTAEYFNLPVYQPENKSQITEIVKDVNPDIIVTAVYKVIIPQEALDIPKFGAINIHPSLLPKYRGPSPIVSAILNGDKETGVTIIKMTSEMDKGPILKISQIDINKNETTVTLTEKLARLAMKDIVEVIPKWVSGTIKEKPQDDNLATYCKIIHKQDGQIDWKESALNIEQKIRAYAPWPGTFTFWNNKSLKILKAYQTELKLNPGMVKVIDNSLIIGTGLGSLKVIDLQLEGKKVMSSAEFINGYSNIDSANLG